MLFQVWKFFVVIIQSDIRTSEKLVNNSQKINLFPCEWIACTFFVIFFASDFLRISFPLEARLYYFAVIPFDSVQSYNIIYVALSQCFLHLLVSSRLFQSSATSYFSRQHDSFSGKNVSFEYLSINNHSFTPHTVYIKQCCNSQNSEIIY